MTRTFTSSDQIHARGFGISAVDESPEETIDRFAGYRADDFQRDLAKRDESILGLTVLCAEQTRRGDRWRTAFYLVVGVCGLLVLRIWVR